MSKQYVRIKSIKKVTHDTLSIVTEKPDGFTFKPGQATNIAIDRKGWEEEARPFTFASLPEDDFFEFVIKTYPEHDGATDKLLDVQAGERLILSQVYGTIEYKGEGVFIAGGSGITPFLSILRDLHRKSRTGNNKLIFANKTEKDIILKGELEEILGESFVNILSEEKIEGYEHGFVNDEFLKREVGDFNGYFYLCGPPVMMNKVEGYLNDLGVDKDQIVKETF